MMVFNGKRQYLPLMPPVLILFLLAAVFMLTGAPGAGASLSQNRVGGYHPFGEGAPGLNPT
jgi:hypothetical protein